jgi:hypothetical protein
VTMLAPRSYLFTRQQPSHSSSSKSKNEGANSKQRTHSPDKQDKKTSLPAMSATTTETEERPTTPSSPVIIPLRGTRDTSPAQRSQTRTERRQNGRKQSDRFERRSRTVHSPDAIPPSVAALLAITSIPPPKSNSSVRRRTGAEQRLTVNAILEHTGVSEKEYSLSLGRSSLDLLLSPPEELEEDDLVGSEAGRESIMSSRTLSSDSMPSLDDESMLSPSPSCSSLLTPSSRGKRSIPKRRIQSLQSPGSDGNFGDPLSRPDIDLDDLDFRVFQQPQNIQGPKPDSETGLPKRKSAFKSNLTASLKALRSAARSFSTLTTPMVTPDDFLTRSIISIDPQVPFTDERMPPRLEDTPTPALRRYLNPTTNAPIEAYVPSSLMQTMSTTKITASIQLQTYKISRSARSTSPSVISRRTRTTPEEVFADVAAGPVARQRDMRENSDFIRVAVMEMAMRKKGKLDDQKPGRARWALPPRKPSTKPYQIGENGIPVRWIAVTQ